MFCNHCGAQLDEGTKFCSVCGAPVSGEESAQAAPAHETPAYEQPVYAPGAVFSNPYYGKTLMWGILSLAFACTFWVSFMGIVFGVLAKKTGDQALEANNGMPLTGKAKVGSILGKVGLILGIVMTVIAVIYVIVLIAIALFGLGAYQRYY